jgi:single-stranded-DNA-specific exonuclease
MSKMSTRSAGTNNEGKDSEPLNAKLLARKFNIPEKLISLLLQRGLERKEDFERFFNPQLTDLPDPGLLKGVGQGAELIVEAVEKGQQVVVHGDYDVDGITATVLLVDFFHSLGLEVEYYIPNRMNDGYGLSGETVDALAAKVRKPAVMVTVDCGISSVEEVRYANKLGFKVIVTDHHEPGEILPPAATVINPKQEGCRFPFSELSGVGVAFYLIIAVRRKMMELGLWSMEKVPNLKKYLDLVALGTVADVVELTGVNRILVRAGLEVLAARNRPGLAALCEVAGIDRGDCIKSEDIGFKLAPRINASGRLGCPEVAAQLLLSPTMQAAKEKALLLERHNSKRKKLEKEALIQALEQARHQVEAGACGLVVTGRKWHPGIVGIIAARIVHTYNLPVLALTLDPTGTGEMLKGSGRSVEGVNLFELLKKCKNNLEQFGGHAMAAGITLKADKLADFKRAFDWCAGNALTVAGQQNSNKADIVFDQIDSCQEMVNGLEKLEPFGQGNVEPVFLCKGVHLTGISRLQDHLKFSLLLNRETVHGIGFFMADKIKIAHEPVDLFFKLKKTSFRGQERVEAHAVSIVPTS